MDSRATGQVCVSFRVILDTRVYTTALRRGSRNCHWTPIHNRRVGGERDARTSCTEVELTSAQTRPTMQKLFGLMNECPLQFRTHTHHCLTV